jgi:hypothetical protein
VFKSGRIGKSLLKKSKRRSRSASKKRSVKRSVRRRSVKRSSKKRSVRRRSVKRSSKKRSARRSDIPVVVTHQGKKYYKKDSTLILKKVNGKNVWFRVWMEPLDKYRSRQRSRSRSQKLKRKVLHEVRVSKPVLKSKSKKNQIPLFMIMMSLSNEDYLDQVIENPSIIYSSPVVLNLWKTKRAGWLPYFKKNQTIPLKDKIMLADLLTGGSGKKLLASYVDGYHSKLKTLINSYVNKKYGNQNVPERGKMNFVYQLNLNWQQPQNHAFIFHLQNDPDTVKKQREKILSWERNLLKKIKKIQSLIEKDQRDAKNASWNVTNPHVIRLAKVLEKLNSAKEKKNKLRPPNGNTWHPRKPGEWQSIPLINSWAIKLSYKGRPVKISKKGFLKSPEKGTRAILRLVKQNSEMLKNTINNIFGSKLIHPNLHEPRLNTADIDGYKYEDLINEILLLY